MDLAKDVLSRALDALCQVLATRQRHKSESTSSVIGFHRGICRGKLTRWTLSVVRNLASGSASGP